VLEECLLVAFRTRAGRLTKAVRGGGLKRTSASRVSRCENDPGCSVLSIIARPHEVGLDSWRADSQSLSMARARNYPMCKNAKNRNATRMTFFNSISKSNVFSNWLPETVLDE
jgi:hypothetical protein